MDTDARRMRGERPFVMTNLKKSEGLDRIVGFIEDKGGLRTVALSGDPHGEPRPQPKAVSSRYHESRVRVGGSVSSFETQLRALRNDGLPSRILQNHRGALLGDHDGR